MRRTRAILSLLLASFLGAVSVAADAPTLLLGEDFPLEVSLASHGSLLHWLDSLTGLEGVGMTAGKTVTAHRQQYRRLFGELQPEDRQQLDRFVQARLRAAASNRIDNPDALTMAFLETGSLDEAQRAASRILDADVLEPLMAALRHFEPHHRRVWQDGALRRAFVKQSAEEPRRVELAAFLVRVAGFYGVSPQRVPAPRLHPVPVVDGSGTHAQAIGRHLLIEIRLGEGLLDQVGPIVHENAHFLFHRMDRDLRRRLDAVVARHGEPGAAAWRTLIEALPTALAQGVASQRFQPQRWSRQGPWYNTPQVDRYARRLFPLVRRTLDRGGSFDETFLERALAAHDAAPPATGR